MPRIMQPNVLKQGLGALVAGIAVAAASAGGWFYWQHHFWTALHGPTEVSLAELAKIDNPNQLPSTWIKVKPKKLVETDVAIEESRVGSSVIVERYSLFQVGDRWMIAVVPGQFSGKELSGQVWHNNGYMNNDAFLAIHKDYQNVHHGRLFPFEFHAEVDYGGNWTLLPVAMGVCGGIGVFFGCLGFVGIRQSFRDPSGALVAGEVDSAAMTLTDDTIARIMRDAGTGRRK